MASEISGLANLHGYLKSGNLVVRLSFPYIELPNRQPAYIERAAKIEPPQLREESAAPVSGNGAREQKIEPQPQEVKQTQQQVVRAAAARVLKREDPLKEPYIRLLHKRMFGDTWRWAGTYRKRETNIGIQFTQITERIGQLLGNARYWLENKTFPIDEIAVRFHHQLVFIHPFPNGNGRHTRMMADVIAVRSGRDAFTWGRTNLQDAGGARTTYIAALQEADLNQDRIGKLLEFARS
jgi:Fic-DOC domain mobile mystery protein B